MDLLEHSFLLLCFLSKRRRRFSCFVKVRNLCCFFKVIQRNKKIQFFYPINFLFFNLFFNFQTSKILKFPNLQQVFFPSLAFWLIIQISSKKKDFQKMEVSQLVSYYTTFKWVPNQTPMSSLWHPFIWCSVYLLGIRFLQNWMKPRVCLKQKNFWSDQLFIFLSFFFNSRNLYLSKPLWFITMHSWLFYLQWWPSDFSLKLLRLSWFRFFFFGDLSRLRSMIHLERILIFWLVLWCKAWIHPGTDFLLVVYLLP